MLITNANVITWNNTNEILEDHAVYIRGADIIDMGPSDDLEYRYADDKDIVDVNGKYLMPGNICAHTHFYSAFSRGMPVAGDPPTNFVQILKQLWWPLDKSLDLAAIKSSAEISILEAIKYGTTTLIDHHASQNVIEGSLETIAEVVIHAGIRAALCYEVSDRDGMERSEQGIKENLVFLERMQSEPGNDNLLAGLFGLHASMTLSDNTLDRCREAAPAGTGFHIHLAEDKSDQTDSLTKYGIRVTTRLNKHGILGDRTVLVHGVHLTEDEIYIIAETKSWLTHQPRSNMNNAVGLPDIERLISAGIPVCLGNDGFSNAMWEEWKTLYLAHKLNKLCPTVMNGNIVPEMAIHNNRRLIHKLFNSTNIGIIEPGAKADLIIVDYKPHTLLTGANLPWHILFGFNEKMVLSTIVNGKFLMRDNQLISMDEEKIMCEALKLSSATWKRYQRQFSRS